MIRLTMIAAAALSLGFAAPAAAQDKYGAIAYSFSKGKTGRSWGYNTQQDAQARAMLECRNAGGRNCRLAVTVRNSCGAFAAPTRNAAASRSGASWDYARVGDAQERALLECRKRDSTGTCRIVTQVCS